MIKLSDYVMKYLVQIGVKDIFMLAGGGCMHLVDSLGKISGLNYIANLHEQAASISAEAYSQYTNNIGVALVTTGPGATNAITGVASAWIDSVPLLIISGQVKRAHLMKNSGVRQMGPQEVDIISMVKSITKYSKTIVNPKLIKYHLQKAVFLAKNGRPGPVWLDIPLDIQGSVIDESMLKEFTPNKSYIKKDINTKIEKVISLIIKAERPVILAGNGIRLADSKNSFIKLIEILNIPVLTTWKAMDILSENHNLFFGRPGAIGQRSANFIQQNSDLIIVLGARLDYNQIAFDYKNFAREAKKVIVDIDKFEIAKIGTHIDVPINIDVKDFINLLLERKKKFQSLNFSEWLNICKKWKRKYPVILDEYKKNKGKVNTYALIDVLSKLLTEKDVIIPGSSGSCSEITMQAFKVKKGQRIFNSPGLGSMGFGLPASIGACLASGKHRTICITGDGGLQHNIQELELLKRYNLPIKLFVLNNNGYASIRATQINHFNRHFVGCDPDSGLTLPNIIKIAKAYGLRTEKIENNLNIEKIVKKVLKFHGPVLSEVMVDTNLVTAPRVSSEIKPDGRIVSKPMEDLWPYLDRKEFKENMIIKPLES